MTAALPKKRGLSAVALLLAILALLVIGQLTAKQGASYVADGWEQWRAGLPFLLVAYTALMTRGLLWILVLRRVQLSLAYPILATAYVVIIVASRFLFDEPLGLLQVGGALLIVAGVTLLGLAKLGGKR